MQKVVITSSNPVKIAATKSAFTKLLGGDLEFLQMSSPSGVSDQPMSSTETLTGAQNRVEHLINSGFEADFYVGMEGGVELVDEDLVVFGWVYIQDKNQKIGKSKTAEFTLPKKITDLIINEHKELGEADDIVFGRENSKQSNGSVGILTQDVITREVYLEHAAVLALIPFSNPSLY
jgi:inosine/xanthosine triphosphatase